MSEDDVEALRTALLESRHRIACLIQDFETYRRRVERELKNIESRTKERLLLRILPQIEALEKAIVVMRRKKVPKSVIKGLQMIIDDMFKSLESEGLEIIEAVGKRFDPKFHEAVKVVPANEDNIVLEEVERGYMLDGRVIKQAKVVVGRKVTP